MRETFAALAVALTLAACAGPEPETTDPAPQPEPAPAADIRTEEVAYEVGGVPLAGYLAWDGAQEGPRPGVLVVHEWWGHNDYARMRAEKLAEMGYTALALDMYGDGKLAEHPEDAQKFAMEVIGQMDVAEARFAAARELLEAHQTTDPTRTAAIGYCFGGAVVLHMTRKGTGLAGVASFHGDLTSMAEVSPEAVDTRVLVLNGAEDPFVTAEAVEAFQQEMTDGGVDYEFIDYPGVVHSFTNPGATEIGEKFGLPLAYDEAADQASWAELERFLSEIFGG